MRKGIKEKDIRDFEKYANGLNDVIVRIREYRPEANIYAAQESLYLMSEPPYDNDEMGNQDAIVTDVMISGMDSGAW